MQNKPGHKERRRDRNGDDLFYMALLLAGSIAVDDLHLFEARDHFDRARECLGRIVGERHALVDEVDRRLLDVFELFELLFEFRRTGSAIQIFDANDTPHKKLPRTKNARQTNI